MSTQPGSQAVENNFTCLPTDVVVYGVFTFLSEKELYDLRILGKEYCNAIETYFGGKMDFYKWLLSLKCDEGYPFHQILCHDETFSFIDSYDTFTKMKCFIRGKWGTIIHHQKCSLRIRSSNIIDCSLADIYRDVRKRKLKACKKCQEAFRDDIDRLELEKDKKDPFDFHVGFDCDFIL